MKSSHSEWLRERRQVTETLAASLDRIQHTAAGIIAAITATNQQAEAA